MSDHREQARELLQTLVPRGRPLVDPRIPLQEDECRWFLEGVKANLIQFVECRDGCSRYKRRTGKREQAREHLATATTMYREMGMTYWPEKAEVETTDLGR